MLLHSKLSCCAAHVVVVVVVLMIKYLSLRMTQIEEIKDKVRRIKSCRSKLNNLMMFLSENNLEGIEVELKLPQENELQITV